MSNTSKCPDYENEYPEWYQAGAQARCNGLPQRHPRELSELGCDYILAWHAGWEAEEYKQVPNRPSVGTLAREAEQRSSKQTLATIIICLIGAFATYVAHGQIMGSLGGSPILTCILFFVCLFFVISALSETNN